MPDEENVPNQEAAATEQAPKKKGLLKRLVLVFLTIMIAAGGAGGFYYWRHRAAVRTQAAAEATDHKAGASQKHAAQGDETDVKEVIELQPFIVNLADRNETRYLRMTISLGVSDNNEAKADPIYTTRVRNAILAVITTKSSDQVLTVEGKSELRKEMLNAARAAVDKPEIQAIYITDFIVQM